uniref:Uncharacterized protein n=1 Tax=Aegilops tauschii subsp. strangulata TaxID=200361 RepID=A0A453F0U9_AEGTS
EGARSRRNTDNGTPAAPHWPYAPLADQEPHRRRIWARIRSTAHRHQLSPKKHQTMEATTTATQLGPPALAVAHDLPTGTSLAAPLGHRREPPPRHLQRLAAATAANTGDNGGRGDA